MQLKFWRATRSVAISVTVTLAASNCGKGCYRGSILLGRNRDKSSSGGIWSGFLRHDFREENVERKLEFA